MTIAPGCQTFRCGAGRCGFKESTRTPFTFLIPHIKVHGPWCHLYRAIDRDGDLAGATARVVITDVSNERG